MFTEVLKEPNPILRQISKEVELPLSDEDKQTLNDLYAYVREHNVDCVGMAAPQFGISKRLIAYRYRDNDGRLIQGKLVNPKIITHTNKKQYHTEGCMSVNGHRDKPVERYWGVTVTAYNAITDRYVTIVAYGYYAIILQHEIDHLDGILFTDHMVDQL